jgi:hypothetical protein
LVARLKVQRSRVFFLGGIDVFENCEDFGGIPEVFGDLLKVDFRMSSLTFLDIQNFNCKLLSEHQSYIVSNPSDSYSLSPHPSFTLPFLHLTITYSTPSPDLFLSLLSHSPKTDPTLSSTPQKHILCHPVSSWGPQLSLHKNTRSFELPPYRERDLHTRWIISFDLYPRPPYVHDVGIFH